MKLTTMIIEVACMVAFDDLDIDDQDQDGNCGVDGSYKVTLSHNSLNDSELCDTALEAFHSTVPISCLEDFMITCRKQTALDKTLTKGSFRRNLGTVNEDQTQTF